MTWPQTLLLPEDLRHATLRDLLRKQSMSTVENCYDNAFMESCFGTVKTELELVVPYEHHVSPHKRIVQPV